MKLYVHARKCSNHAYAYARSLIRIGVERQTRESMKLRAARKISLTNASCPQMRATNYMAWPILNSSDEV